jgi:hypothetical protein
MSKGRLNGGGHPLLASSLFKVICDDRREHKSDGSMWHSAASDCETNTRAGELIQEYVIVSVRKVMERPA